MEDKKPQFVGITRIKRFSNGGSIIKLGLKIEELNDHVNERGFVNLLIKKRKNAQGNDKDYYTMIDDFIPKPKDSTFVGADTEEEPF